MIETRRGGITGGVLVYWKGGGKKRKEEGEEFRGTKQKGRG